MLLLLLLLLFFFLLFLSLLLVLIFIWILSPEMNVLNVNVNVNLTVNVNVRVSMNVKCCYQARQRELWKNLRWCNTWKKWELFWLFYSFGSHTTLYFITPEDTRKSASMCANSNHPRNWNHSLSVLQGHSRAPKWFMSKWRHPTIFNIGSHSRTPVTISWTWADISSVTLECGTEVQLDACKSWGHARVVID